MNRREFFRRGIVGGVAAAAAVRSWPFRVFSFPTAVEPATEITAVRFVKCFDPFQKRMINRFDVLYGWQGLNLEVPRAIESAHILKAKEGLTLESSDVDFFVENMRQNYALDFPAGVIQKRLSEKTGQSIIIGYDFPA